MIAYIYFAASRLLFWGKLKDRVLASEKLQRAFGNIGWLFFDKFMRMGLGLFVGVWIARFLGPEQYGQWNYASAFASLFGAFASLGIDQIVIRNLVQRPESHGRLMGTALGIKLMGGAGAMFLPIIGMCILEPKDHASITLVAISSTSFLLQAFHVFDLLFQARSVNKRTVIALNLAYLLSTSARLLLVLNHANLYAFALMVTLEVGIGGLFLFISYFRYGETVRTWHFDWKLAKQILGESWPLILASSVSLLNMRIDQVFIGGMIDNSAVGCYSAAVRIAEIWLMVPAIFGQVLYPMIIEAKTRGEIYYRQRIFLIFKVMLALTLPVAIGVSIFSDEIIEVVFGPGFTGAGSILSIQIWTGAPSLILFVFGQVFYVEKIIRNHLYATAFQPIANVCLNLILIPRYGAIGAAIATMLTAFGSHIITLVVLEYKVNFFTRGFRKAQVGE